MFGDKPPEHRNVCTTPKMPTKPFRELRPLGRIPAEASASANRDAENLTLSTKGPQEIILKYAWFWKRVPNKSLAYMLRAV